MSGKTLTLTIVLGLALTIFTGCAWRGDSTVRTTARQPDTKPAATDEAQILRAPLVIGPGAATHLESEPLSSPAPRSARLLTNATRHTFTTVGRDFDPDVHPDGRRIVFASTRHHEQPGIYMQAVDGQAMTQLVADSSADIQPRFSPDGHRVAFCSNRAGSWDIWMVDVDGGNLVQLTRDRTDEVAPCWSPDGKQIAYTTWGQRSRQWEIWTLAVDQPGVKRFLQYGMFPDWSPDGRYLTYQRARQRGTRWFSVWTVEVDGGEARHPTEVAYSPDTACIAPRWSPDGRSIVYSEVFHTGVVDTPNGEPVESVLATVDPITGVRRRLTNGGAAFNPTWGPNGEVFFVSAQAGVENIWSLPPGAVGTAAEKADR